jgi:hypothetical protein
MQRGRGQATGLKREVEAEVEALPVVFGVRIEQAAAVGGAAAGAVESAVAGRVDRGIKCALHLNGMLRCHTRVRGQRGHR